MLEADDQVRHIYKNDFEHPAGLYDEHSDLPLASERLVVQADFYSHKQKTIYSQIYGTRSLNFTQKKAYSKLIQGDWTCTA